MKKINKTEELNQGEWAELAARLSGERNGSASAEDLSATEKGLQKQWNDIKMTYREKEIDVDKAWDKVSSMISAGGEKKSVRLRPAYPLFMKIAASVLLVAGLGWAAMQLTGPKETVIASAADEKNIMVTLPDGSTVWLNRNSTLTYPQKFGKNDRRVKLNGEAFFDVERDEAKPFIIDAGKADIRVLGTSFNVRSDNGSKEVEVFVATGSVMVTSHSGDNSVTLKPGFIGRVSETNASDEQNPDANYMSWNTEKLVYNGQDLTRVFSDLKRAYDIDITADDPGIQHLTLTSVFEDMPHDTIIKVICTTFNLTYEKRGEQYVLLKK